MGLISAETYLRVIRGETRGPLAAVARGCLALASAGYGVGAAARNRGFDRGRDVHRARVPVVSVGNLTLGGTGKTPMVEWLARWYRERGVRVCLISRGYGAAGAVNDEALVLEDNLPDVPHLQDADRVRLAEVAVDELEAELLVLDDGFQHRRLARDLDVVLLDALDPFGLGRLFPRGLLREPVSSLGRAGVIVVTRADLVNDERRDWIRGEARHHAPNAPILAARHAPRELLDGEGIASPLDGLAGRSVAAFCGLGNPQGFRMTLESLGCRVADLRVFPDHHPYTADDVSDLIRWVDSVRPELVLTTQKDLVKLRLSNLGDAPLRALRIGLDFLVDPRPLDDLLAALLPDASPTSEG